MENILETYKNKLDDFSAELRRRVYIENDIESALDDIKNELADFGKSNLKMLFSELKSYIEKNNPDFIKNNKEKWEKILDKADALSEYGLYVAPIDLLRNNDNSAKAVYVGLGTFLSSALLTKITSKKVKFLPSVLSSLLGGAAAYYLFNLNKDDKMKEALIGYMDDAHDWISTAFENMYKIFKDAK